MHYVTTSNTIQHSSTLGRLQLRAMATHIAQVCAGLYQLSLLRILGVSQHLLMQLAEHTPVAK